MAVYIFNAELGNRLPSVHVLGLKLTIVVLDKRGLRRINRYSASVRGGTLRIILTVKLVTRLKRGAPKTGLCAHHATSFGCGRLKKVLFCGN